MNGTHWSLMVVNARYYQRISNKLYSLGGLGKLEMDTMTNFIASRPTFENAREYLRQAVTDLTMQLTVSNDCGPFVCVWAKLLRKQPPLLHHVLRI